MTDYLREESQRHKILHAAVILMQCSLFAVFGNRSSSKKRGAQSASGMANLVFQAADSINKEDWKMLFHG
jgi:hypothetical protein